MNVFGFGYALVAFAVMGFIPMIAADSNLMSSKNWTEENIVSLFRSHGENFCAQTDVCGNNRSTKANVVNDSELTSCCDGLFYLLI
ncbi:hypothetical protein DPMN_052372 [Dreissena polymorpha]|uniref:Uncharacterized protein n=1 Tax=Dreissena polymorpha TaxID=45954 RepID=A0A9D4HPT8_DREPO|nr:hypothetical protein DPMN_052372 [Dreissena polymorpha]